VIKGELEALRTRRALIMEGIKAAAGSGDSKTVLTLSENLRRADQLLFDHESWLHSLDSYLSRSTADDNEDDLSPPGSGAPALARVSGRAHGVALRAEFLRRAASSGLKLLPHRGAIYKTERGTRVGIAVASERQRNRWFLGLSQDGFDSAVLLCQSSSGKTFSICLPCDFVRRHRFSRAGGQDKFNVVRRAGRLFLTIPNLSPVPVDQFAEAISGLG
jgi:hypothetical protein